MADFGSVVWQVFLWQGDSTSMGLFDPIYSSLSSDQGYSDLIQDFVNEIPFKCESIESFVATGNFSQLHRMIHQLRGSCGGYGFPILTETASEIDEALKAGATIEDIKPRLGNFLALLKRATATPIQS